MQLLILKKEFNVSQRFQETLAPVNETILIKLNYSFINSINHIITSQVRLLCIFIINPQYVIKLEVLFALNIHYIKIISAPFQFWLTINISFRQNCKLSLHLSGSCLHVENMFWSSEFLPCHSLQDILLLWCSIHCTYKPHYHPHQALHCKTGIQIIHI